VTILMGRYQGPPSRSAHMRGPRSSNRRSARRAVTMPLAGSACSTEPPCHCSAQDDGSTSSEAPVQLILLAGKLG
jgi:hypothetical protein